MREASWLLGLVSCGGWLGCATPPPSPPVPTPTVSSAPATPSATPPAPAPAAKLDGPGARYVPGAAFREIGSGRLAAVYAGRRLVVKGAEVEVVDRAPIEDLGSAHRIPDVLGGGYLFVGEHTIWFAKELDGALVRIAAVGVEPRELVVGVGRNSVLVGDGKAAPTLYELPSGKVVAPSPAGTVELFGTSKGMVAARTAKGELFVSLASGAPFKKITAPRAQRLGYDGRGIVVYTDKSDMRLGFDGKLVPRPNEPGMTVASNLDAFDDVFPDVSKPPPEPSDAERLVDALTRSIDPSTAFVVRNDDLSFIDAATGKVTKIVAGAFSGHKNCFIVRGGTPAFVGCNEEKFRLFRLDGVGTRPVLEREIGGIYTQDFGEPLPDAPLAFPRKCDGSEQKGAACLRQSKDVWKDLAPPADPAGLLAKIPFLVHIAASREGRVFMFGWLDGGGDLVIVDSGSKSVRRVAKSNLPAWAGGGVDWHALGIEKDTLRFLISSQHAEPGVVEIRSDDSVDAKRFGGRMSAEGPRALRIGEDGKLSETTDAGHSFHEVEPPPGGVSGSKRDLFACRETGCIIGPWYRLGWSSK